MNALKKINIKRKLLSAVCFRCRVHALPNAAITDGVPHRTQQSADQLRQLSIPHAGIRGGALQGDSELHRRELLENQRCERQRKVAIFKFSV